MRRWIAALLVALASCTNSTQPRPLPSASLTPTPSPRGGTLTIAYPYEPTTLDPFALGGAAMATRDLIRPLWPALYVYGPGGTKSRGLADVDPPATASTVTVRLRAGARWSDGKPITSEDVVFTWKAVMSPSNHSASKEGFDQVTAMEASSPTEVTIHLKSASERWIDMYSGALGVLPKHALFGKALDVALARAWPVSGGPFVLRTWTPGLEMIFDRNPHWWGSPVQLDRLRVQFVPDAVTAMQLLKAKKVDALGPYGAVDFARRAALTPGSKVTQDFGTTTASLAITTKRGPMADAKVREALLSALDISAVVDGLVRGEGKSLSTTRPRNLAHAKALLDEAGWKGASGTRRKGSQGLSVTVANVGADEVGARVLRAFHRQAAEAGIDLNVVDLEMGRLWRDWLRSARFQVAFLVNRAPARPAESAPLDLWVVAVDLVTGPGVEGLQANATSAGPFWNAESWARAS